VGRRVRSAQDGHAEVIGDALEDLHIIAASGKLHDCSACNDRPELCQTWLGLFRVGAATVLAPCVHAREAPGDESCLEIMSGVHALVARVTATTSANRDTAAPECDQR
jgi:hypothetical protein